MEHPQYVQHRPFSEASELLTEMSRSGVGKLAGRRVVTLVNFGSGHVIRKICHLHFLWRRILS
jgi:hypothetical protein